ncbi:MAG: glycosyltransferase family 9 protein [Ignavibacteriae bacterium]|nr:glycosyltransferase family 9 protein [Ignavibacteriota bacterium]
MNPNEVTSICIIRLSSMGDILLITPLLRQLRNQFPHARIDMAVAKRFAEIIRYFRKQKLELVKLKKGFGKPIIPIAERYRSTANALKVQDDKKGLELWLPEEKDLGFYPPEKRINITNPPKLLAIAPGARHFTKRWLPERFAETALLFNEQFNTQIVLLGGTDDREICNEVRRQIPFPITDATGSTSIYDTTRALDLTDGLICNDSGIMHLAAARHVPVAAIFGSTVREFGFAPYRVANTIIEKELDCRPCTHIGRDECPLGHFKCMNLISPEEVVNQYLSIKN